MAKEQITFSAERLFEIMKDNYEPDLHDALRAEIAQQFPNGITVNVVFAVGEGQKPTRH